MRKEKIFEIINCIILLIILILCALYIGTPLKNNTEIINAVTTILTFIYLIACKIGKYKIKIIPDNKMYLLLLLSSVIPLIFSTYASAEGTVEYILRYTTIICVYILAINIKNIKYKKYLINGLIISGIFMYFTAMDANNLNILKDFLENLGNLMGDKDKNFSGGFGYTNTFGIYLGAISLLCIWQYLNNKSKYLKPLFGAILYIFISGVLLSESVTTILLLAGILIIYVILLRDRYKRIETIILCLIELIVALINIKIYNWSIEEMEYVITYVMCFALILPSYIIIYFSKYLTNFINNIKLKPFIIVGSILIIILIGYIAIGLTLTEPIVLFENKSTEKLEKDIRNIEPNTKYTIEIDFDAKTTKKTNDTYRIIIKQRNKFNDTIESIGKNFGEFNNTYKVDITTKNEAEYITIAFLIQNPIGQERLTINRISINGKNIPLQYKIFPSNIVNTITDLNINTKSITDRLTYMKDGLKLSYQNLMFGIGGDGWKYREREAQSYNYYANEPHSYLIEILLEFGIIGFIAIIGILVEIFINFKNKFEKSETEEKEFNKTIFCVLLLIILHSIIDFDMSFLIIQITVFLLLGLLTPEQEVKKVSKLNKVSEIVLIIYMIIISVVNVQRIITKNYKTNGELGRHKMKVSLAPYVKEYQEKLINELEENGNTQEAIEECKKLIEKETYNDTLINLEKMYNIIGKENLEENVENLKYIVDKIRNIKINCSVEEILSKNDFIIELAEKINDTNEKQNSELINIEKELKGIFAQEYETNKNKIKDIEKNRLTQEQANIKLQELEEQKMKLDKLTILQFDYKK